MYTPVKYLTSFDKKSKKISYFFCAYKNRVISIESKPEKNDFLSITCANNPCFLGIKIFLVNKRISASVSLLMEENVQDFKITLPQAINVLENISTNVFIEERAVITLGIEVSKEMLLNSIN